jgi:hypothetical protein
MHCVYVHKELIELAQMLLWVKGGILTNGQLFQNLDFASISPSFEVCSDGLGVSVACMGINLYG